MPRFTANQMFQTQNNLNKMKRDMNKPSNMSLNQYFQENSAASLKANPNVLKLRPSQFHNKNEWDGDIMKLEYTINKENVLREHFNEPDQELQNYNIPIDVDKQNKLMKSINNVIREVQKSITEDNLGTTYLNIVKLFNDFSLSYNASVSQIRDDKNFQLVFNERLITLEDLIRTCLQTATIGRYNEIPKESNYRYSTTEFLNAFQDMIKIIGEMLITKNISLYIGDARPSQISVQPSFEVEGKEEIDDMRDDAEEIERMRRERDDGDHGDPFMGDREEGFDRGVEESKGLDEGMISVVVAYDSFVARRNEISREEEGVDDGEEPETEEDIESRARGYTPEKLKSEYLIAVNNFLDMTDEIKAEIAEGRDTDPSLFIQQAFNPIFRMNLETLDEVVEYLERIKTYLTGTEAPRTPPRDTEEPPREIEEEPDTQRMLKKNVINGFMSVIYTLETSNQVDDETESEINREIDRMTEYEITQKYREAIEFCLGLGEDLGNLDMYFDNALGVINFIFDASYETLEEAKTELMKLLEEQPMKQDLKAIKQYFQDEIKTALLPLFTKIKVSKIFKKDTLIVEIAYSGLKDFSQLYKVLFQRAMSVFYNVDSHYSYKTVFNSGILAEIYRKNGSEQLNTFIVKLINDFLTFSQIKITRSTKPESIVAVLNSKFQTKLKNEGKTEFELFINSLNVSKLSLFDYSKFDLSKFTEPKAKKLKEVLDTMKREGF
jgi:hypothetical protein